MKFRNIKTGNILETENEDAIALMTASKNYEVVKEKKSGKTDGNVPAPAPAE